MEEYKSSKRISVYLSMPSEVQTEGILKVNNNIHLYRNLWLIFLPPEQHIYDHSTALVFFLGDFHFSFEIHSRKQLIILNKE